MAQTPKSIRSKSPIVIVKHTHHQSSDHRKDDKNALVEVGLSADALKKNEDLTSEARCNSEKSSDGDVQFVKGKHKDFNNKGSGDSVTNDDNADEDDDDDDEDEEFPMPANTNSPKGNGSGTALEVKDTHPLTNVMLKRADTAPRYSQKRRNFPQTEPQQHPWCFLQW